ncbi:hypothetical protein ACF1AE_30970 [Streptomyces sp. NPDC014986]|uniref:hypothetical protein n=1 Tax=Streptomyces sp. NPDC014986 TaxID=3364934 RepID=UPI0036FFF043
MLALHHPDSALTCVELDDRGAPLPVDEAGADLIDRVEASWPRPGFTPADDEAGRGGARESYPAPGPLGMPPNCARRRRLRGRISRQAVVFFL